MPYGDRCLPEDVKGEGGEGGAGGAGGGGGRANGRPAGASGSKSAEFARVNPENPELGSGLQPDPDCGSEHPGRRFLSWRRARGLRERGQNRG